MSYSWTQKVFDQLTADSRTLALAESCTGGLACAEITSIAGASKIFRGGIIAYANAVKIQLLKVPEDLLEKKGPVSPEIAMAMAAGAKKRFGSDVAAAVTGLAGPGYGGGPDPLPVGTVWMAFVDDHRQECLSEHFEGGRAAVRSSATKCLFHYLALFLSNDLPDRPA